MHRFPAISKSYALSIAMHVMLLLGAFLSYDPSATNLYDDEVVERLFITTMPSKEKEQPKTVKEEPPEPPIVKRRRPIQRRKKPVRKPVIQPTEEPEVAKPEPEKKPKLVQKSRKAVVKAIGVKSKSAAKRDVAKNTSTQAKARGAVQDAPPADPEAKVVDKVDIRRLERSYYGTLSRFLKQNYEYPRRARVARIEGVVLIEVVIDSKGRILRRRIARSSGSELLDQAAMTAIAKIAQVPAPPGGLPWSRRAVRIPFKYKLRT